MRACLLALLSFGCQTVNLLGDCGDGFASPGELCLGPEERVPVGSAPRQVLLGDLDGDADLDVLVNDTTAEDIGVLLNEGDGALAPERRFPVGNAVALALGDLDGDGALDLAAACSREESVAVLLNDGAGGFGAPSLSLAGLAPSGVALGDIDGDGDLDLAAPDLLANAVDLFENEGGALSFVTRFPVGSAPQAVRLLDLTGDGLPELLVANSDFAVGLVGIDTVSRLVNEGGFSFSVAPSLEVGDEPVALAEADLDGDGRLDILSANFRSGDISLLFGASGGFAPEQRLPAEGAFALAAGDLDGDATPDLAVAGTAGLRLELGLGEGLFAPGQALSTAAIPSVALGDLNGDGALDIAFVVPASDELRLRLSQP